MEEGKEFEAEGVNVDMGRMQTLFGCIGNISVQHCTMNPHL